MTHLMSWLQEYQLLISLLAGVSLILLALTLLATPWLVAQLPADYLLADQTETASRSMSRWIVLTIRCIAGMLLMLLGIVMMVTPGPGLIVLLLGISIARFPGKQRLLVFLATRPSVFQSLNWMRKRYDKPPFVAPHTTLQ